MTTDPLGTFKDDLIAAAIRSQPRQARRRLLLAVASTLVVGAIAGAWLMRTPWESGDDTLVAGGSSSTSQPATDEVDGSLPAGAIWSIASPPKWHRAGAELMPNLVGTSLTLATIPLSVGGERCAQVPEAALRSLGREDALISIFFRGPEDVDDPTWPAAGFDDTVFPRTDRTDAHECADRADLEVHWGGWSLDGAGLYLLVAFGPGVSSERRAETWAAVSSLHPEEGAATAAPVCVTTRPPQPGLDVPDDWPARPTSGTWYGSTDLWTVLPADGSSPTPRKSVWWSADFLGGGAEPRPDISVTWNRLDKPAATAQAGSPGTNASSAEEGSFMIAGGDPPGVGCWKVTASYRGAALSYVYWNEPRLWVQPDATEDEAQGDIIEGSVGYDETNNCVQLRQAGRSYPVVWPAGTTVGGDGSINLPDGRRISTGDYVVGAGAYRPAEIQHIIPPVCVPDTGEAAVFDPSSELTIRK